MIISGVNVSATFTCNKTDSKKWIWDCRHTENKPGILIVNDILRNKFQKPEFFSNFRVQS